MNQQLKDMLDEFLSEKRISLGGWAKPTLTDMVQLNKLIYELLLLKFELDPDGDLPVKYVVIDKTEEEYPNYIPTKHTHKIRSNKEWLQTLSDLNYNKQLAEDRFQTNFTIYVRMLRDK